MYSNGYMVDSRFNLEDVLKDLLNKNNIRFLKKSDKNILDIPYYNCSDDDDYSKYLKFVFIPTKEEYLKIYNDKKTLQPKEYIFDEFLDIGKYRIKK